jgi:hypothetical protein
MLPKIALGAEVMGSAENGSVGLVCVPSAIPARERAQHFVLAQELLNKQAAERADLPDGYAFRFAADKLVELVRFIDNERKCCPFMIFHLQIGPQAGPIWLRMTGPEGTREVLQAELSLQSSCGCGA